MFKFIKKIVTTVADIILFIVAWYVKIMDKIMLYAFIAFVYTVLVGVIAVNGYFVYQIIKELLK